MTLGVVTRDLCFPNLLFGRKFTLTCIRGKLINRETNFSLRINWMEPPPLVALSSTDCTFSIKVKFISQQSFLLFIYLFFTSGVNHDKKKIRVSCIRRLTTSK